MKDFVKYIVEQQIIAEAAGVPKYDVTEENVIEYIKKLNEDLYKDDKSFEYETTMSSHGGFGGHVMKVIINRNLKKAIADAIAADRYFVIPTSNAFIMGNMHFNKTYGNDGKWSDGYSKYVNLDLSIYQKFLDVKSFVKRGSVKPICKITSYSHDKLEGPEYQKENELTENFYKLIVDYLEKNIDKIDIDKFNDDAAASKATTEDKCPYELTTKSGIVSGIDRNLMKNYDGVRFFLDDVDVDGTTYHIVRYFIVSEFFDSNKEEKIEVFKSLGQLDKFLKWAVSPGRYKHTATLGADGEMHYGGHYMQKHLPAALKKDIVTDDKTVEAIINKAKLKDIDKCIKAFYKVDYSKYWVYKEK